MVFHDDRWWYEEPMSRSIKPTTMRLDDDDKALIEIVKKKYGQSSLIGALRTALRIAAGVDTSQNSTPTHIDKKKGSAV